MGEHGEYGESRSKFRQTARGLARSIPALALAVGAVAGSRAQVCDQPRLYVADNAAQSVFSFDHPAGGAPLATYAAFQGMQGIALDATETTVYVVEQNGGTVGTIALPGGALGSAGTFTLPQDVALSGDESLLYVADSAAGTIQAIVLPGPSVSTVATGIGSVAGVALDAGPFFGLGTLPATGELVAFFPPGPAPGIATGTTPPLPMTIAGIANAPSDHLVYVASADGRLFVVDRRDNTAREIAAGLGNPSRVALDQTGNVAYVPDGAGTVHAIDLATGTVAAFPAAPGVLGQARGVALARAPDPTVFVPDVPDDLTGMVGGQVEVPIAVTNVTGRGVTGVQATLGFDPAVLAVAGIGPGDLTNGCAAFVPSATATSVTVNIGGCPALVGAGPVALIAFDILAAPAGAQSPLTLSGVSLTPLANFCTRDGAFFPPGGAGDLSGSVHYYSDGSPVEDVTMQLTGSGQSVQTDATGDYTLAGVATGGADTLVPTKTGGAGSAVDVVDALVAAQFSGWLAIPTPAQEIAGDVTANCIQWIDPGTGLPVDQCVTILDALRIAQYSAGVLTDFPARNDEWAFLPGTANPPPAPTVRTLQSPSGGTNDRGEMRYNPLATDAPGQDWTALVFGDLIGAPPPAPLVSRSGGAVLDQRPPGPMQHGTRGGGASSFSFGPASINGSVGTVSLIAKDTTGAEALDVVIYYRPDRIAPTGIARTPYSTEGVSQYVSNLDQPGTIYVGMAGELSGGGDVVQFEFELLEGFTAAGAGLDLAVAAVDEGTRPSQLADGQICTGGDVTLPAEVEGLQMSRTDYGVTGLSWTEDPNAATYAVFRGEQNADATHVPVDLDDLGCLGRVASPTSYDGDDPPPGLLQFYLVGAENCAGSSTLGAGTDNTPRPLPFCP